MNFSAPRWERYVASRFDDIGLRLPDSVSPHDPRLESVRNVFSEWAGRRVLDIGCGRGRYWDHFRTWGAEVTGLDISPVSLQRSRPDCLRVVGSSARLPWPDGSFDLACVLETLQHVPDSAIVLREATRVIAPGGVLVVIDRNPLAIDPRRPWLPSLAVKWLDQRRGLWMYPHDAPVRERWNTPARWRSDVVSSFRNWHVTYVDSTEEPVCFVRRFVPLARPFFCMIGRKAA